MFQSFDLNQLQTKTRQEKAAMLGAATKPSTLIEYRTYNEGLCTAYFFSTPKSIVKDDLEALMLLLTKQLFFHQGWSLTDLSADRLDNLYDQWFVPFFNRCEFTRLPIEEADEEMRRMPKSILQLIDKMQTDPFRLKNPDRWGIYKDGQPSTHVIPSMIAPALCLMRKWNEVELLFETEDEYVLYFWITFA